MSRQATLAKLHQSVPVIAPSMLKCDFGNLRREVALLEAAGARALHLDVMDGHFVRNLTYGAPVIDRLRETTELILDAHLMVLQPERLLEDFVKSGCDCITIHIEAVSDPIPLLQQIREKDVVAGLALNPGTPVETIEPVLKACDLILVMSVEPGFGGQAFLPSVLDKLHRLRECASQETLLAVDGGIDEFTIGDAARSGASLFVVGSAIFDRADYRQSIDQLTHLAGRQYVSASL